ncbi:hypothetical protein JOC34_001540 [Virgibacillus halotolerans]|uniref:hypothetical protein n=1 Tax=Virgibacillus halotolerans TaxID=1071053 RepID=UPI00195F4B87|nr:hypothetical protein [Virgibacillus halotolerans]MBM7599172.1 hypothetical protein [Virgibacillus halotolerans]
MNRITKISILILSVIAVLCFSFIPDFGVRTEGGSHFFGFPAEWLGLYGNAGFSFMGLGFLFNIAFFYFIFLFVFKFLIKIFSVNKQR